MATQAKRRIRKRLRCFSCRRAVDRVGDLCYGCSRLVCVECIVPGDHFRNGRHGKAAR
jgi:hypothetical protein